MTPVEVLLFLTILPVQPGDGFVVPPGPSLGARPPIETAVAESVPLVRSEMIFAASDAGGPEARKPGRSRLTKLLIAQAAIAGLSSAGHIAEAFDQPPNDGAEALGAGLLGLGGLLAAIVPMGLADSSKESRGNVKTFLVGCAALMAAGGYDLYLSKHNDGGGARIFRHNMISLNGVWVVAWGIARWRHW